jgi:hypothetical protein
MSTGMFLIQDDGQLVEMEEQPVHRSCSYAVIS